MSLNDDFVDHNAELLRLKASEVELLEGPNAALAVIGPPTDPSRMQTTLGILLRARRFKEAADLIYDQLPNQKWIDLAALVFAYQGDFVKAKSMVAFSEDYSDTSLYERTRVGYAEGVINSWYDKLNGDSIFDNRPWNIADQKAAEDVIEILSPVITRTRAQKKIQGELQSFAIEYAVYCAYISKNRNLLNQCIDLLTKTIPLPLIVAELCLRNLMVCKDNFPNRFRLEHPSSFQAQYLAALLECEILHKAKDAFNSFYKLKNEVTSDQEKEMICIALFETSPQCGRPYINRAIKALKDLHPENDKFIIYLTIIKNLMDNKIDLAKEMLNTDYNTHKDDAIWWQIQAQLCEQMGNHSEAHDAWQKASELLPRAEILRHSIQASMEQKKYKNAASKLEALLNISKDNVNDMEVMVDVLIRLGDFPKATHYLQTLLEIDPTNIEWRLAFADSLSRVNKIEEAIEILKPLCESEAPPLQALLIQSNFLGIVERKKESFELLDSVSEDYWDEPEFLLTYMNNSYAAGKDKEANNAFIRLNELRISGKVPATLMQSGTLEQLIDIFKNERETRETLQLSVIEDRLPWLFVEKSSGNPATWAWTLHTQKLAWLTEDPLGRASYSIYSTNGFTHSPKKRNNLDLIKAAPDNDRIIIDLSALVTLHNLGILELVADYYSELVLPVNYGQLLRFDSSRYGFHQLSQLTAISKIRHAIDSNLINVTESHTSELITVDEYTNDTSTITYKLCDIINLLTNAQKLSLSDLDELKQIAHKESILNENTPNLKVGDRILIQLSTLRALSNLNSFNVILGTFKVYIDSLDYDTLLAEDRAFETAKEAKSSHKKMWDTIKSLETRKKIKWTPITLNDEQIDDEEHHLLTTYVDISLLAEQESLPVLVDDRFFQVLTFNRTNNTHNAAFGTDAFLLALLGSDRLTSKSIAEHYRKLMQWRYRFLTPPPALLKEWTNTSISNLPGDALLDTAVYLHDCLRDPALHCGPEFSDYPVSMAIKFVTTWNQNIVTFFVDILSDNHISDDEVSKLICWSCEELLPSCPKGLFLNQVGNNLARFLPNTILMMAMVEFAFIKNKERANLGLQIICNALNLSNDQQLEITISAIKAIQTDTENKDHSKLLSQLILRNSLLHKSDHTMEPFFVYQFQELGLLNDLSPPHLPQDIPEILRDLNHSNRLPGPDGPFVFVKEENKTIYALEVCDLLLCNEHNIRFAAINFLCDPSTSNWLTQSTRERLDELADLCKSENQEDWKTAGIKLIPMLKKDLFGIFAYCEQAKHFKNTDAFNEYMKHVIHPDFDNLVNSLPPIWNPANQKDEISDGIKELSELDDLFDALNQYLELYGYIPLHRELGASKLVDEWVESHTDNSLTWDNLWSWAENNQYPFAKYHALSIAIQQPRIFNEIPSEQLWAEVNHILEIIDTKTDSTSEVTYWQFLSGLALHYTYHIESIFPGQDGERVACHAWWLTNQVGKLLHRLYGSNTKALQNIISEEIMHSRTRWTFAQSPTTPSLLRFLTLERNSIWSQSLICQLSETITASNNDDIPEEVRTKLGNILKFYFVFTPLATIPNDDSRLLEFQANSNILSLCKNIFPADDYAELEELNSDRIMLKAPNELKSRLLNIKELHINDQFVLIHFLRELVFTTTTHDEAILSWLSLSDQIVECLLQLPEGLLYRMLEALGELQKRQIKKWAIRIPHLLTYTLEQTEDEEKAILLINAIYLISINSDLASPLQRVLNSKWHSILDDLLKEHRYTFNYLSKHSEPWVGARLRAFMALISRQFGPRDYKEFSANATHSKEN